MSSVTGVMVAHYDELLDELRQLDPYITEAMAWVVVRGRDVRLTVDDVVSRLGGDSGTISRRLPLPPSADPTAAAFEQRGDNVLIVASNTYGFSRPEVLAALTKDAQAWGFWWLVNNAHKLFYAADGHLVTTVQIPDFDGHLPCGGENPQALDSYLDGLRALAEEKCEDDEAGDYGVSYPDWPTALATVEAMTGVRLEASWFMQEQLCVSRVPRLS
ncbi:DUF6461 domain-containing protein [Microtetraspora fusca]|uniref:DUF6461 domain-containing protein n=1 Tax=Microtetraspora fusca TaxID=1997 RepID=UPI000A5F7B69|nr:DUF6461 domain-containing protein [Microtetraspora fusca]